MPKVASKHTLGWRYLRSGYGSRNSDFDIVSESGGRVASTPYEDKARLIAAAPELLAACKQAAKLAWEVGSESEDGVLTLLDDSRGDLYRQLSAAITKAEA